MSAQSPALSPSPETVCRQRNYTFWSEGDRCQHTTSRRSHNRNTQVVQVVHASLCWWRSFCLRGVGQGIPLLEPQAAHNAHNGHACNRTGQHSTASSQCISASYQQCHLLAQHKGDKLAHPASCGRGCWFEGNTTEEPSTLHSPPHLSSTGRGQ